MSYVFTFSNVRPPARYDGTPFTRALIKENAVNTYSTANLIETITLSPVDADPSHPSLRTLTTANAAIAQSGWYWLVWEDDASAQYIEEPFQQSGNFTDLELLIRSEFPMTWDALAKDTSLGVAGLRMRIANVKAAVLSEAMANSDDSSYPNLLRSYVAKKCTLDLIPAGIEYWMRMKTTVSTTGTNETTSYSDPVLALEKLRKSLAVEVERLAAHPNLLQYSTKRSSTPAVSYGGALVTSNPYQFPYGFGTDESVGNDAATEDRA